MPLLFWTGAQQVTVHWTFTLRLDTIGIIPRPFAQEVDATTVNVDETQF
jgi:hypothetical protein